MKNPVKNNWCMNKRWKKGRMFWNFVLFFLTVQRTMEEKERGSEGRVKIGMDKLSDPVYHGWNILPAESIFPPNILRSVSHSSSVPDRGHLINPLQRHTSHILDPRLIGTHMVLPSLNRWDLGCIPRLENSRCSSIRIPCGSLENKRKWFVSWPAFASAIRASLCSLFWPYRKSTKINSSPVF